MKPKLPQTVIDQIQSSSESVPVLSARLGVSFGSINRYRPIRRGQLSKSEFDQIYLEWTMGIPVCETAERFGIAERTVGSVRLKSKEMIEELFNV
jgi:hypothetical protein